MSFLPEIFPSLMRWREPNAYSRKDLSPGRRIGFLIFLMIPSLLLILSTVNHNFSKGRIILALFFMVVGILAFIRVWFGSGDVVCLKEDCITKAISRSAWRSLYKNIECCSVNHCSYNDIKFSVLKFTFKKEGGVLPIGEVQQVAVPNDVNLERVLQILRDKGVKVVEEKLTS